MTRRALMLRSARTFELILRWRGASPLDRRHGMPVYRLLSASLSSTVAAMDARCTEAGA